MALESVVDRRALLARIYVFASLERGDLDALAEQAVRRHLEPGEELCHKGDEGDEAWAVVAGKLKASAASEEGRELTFSIMGTGEIVGEIAMLSGGRRTATVTALTPVELLVIRRRDLLDLMRRRPPIAVACLEALAGRVARVSQTLEDALFRNLASRLARTLLVLAEEHGVAAGDETRIEPRLSQTELGNLVGATREAVNKQMRIFERHGWVARRDGRLHVVDHTALEALARPER